jgi:putative serine protease PepD
MTETPDGPHIPQDPHPPQTPHIPPQAGRYPYAGPDWRRPEAAGAPEAYGPPVDDRAGSAASGPMTVAPAGAPDFTHPIGTGPVQQPGQPGWTGRQTGAAGSDDRGGTAHPAPIGPAGAGAYSSTGPAWGAPVATTERPARSGARRLVAVAALTAVLGGVAGGGTVALLNRDDATPVASAGLSRDAGSAPAAATTSGTAEAAAAAALKRVVTLNVTGAQQGGTGSGVIIRADGYILTNQHVVAAAENGGSITATLPDGRTVPATIVGTDTVTDLAVVKVAASGLTAATFADSDAVKIGQTVVAVGSPLGLDGTVTEGIVSALHRPTTGGSDNSAVIDALQTDAAINPGNSGGALVDLAGRVVGINQSIATASSGGGFPGQSGSSGNIGIGFAIPSNTAARVAEQLITSGKATHAFLGVQAGGSGATATPGTGATLASVESGGPAAAAGLKAGDVVTKIGDRVIDGSDELVAAVRSYAPGDKVTLTVRRGAAEQTVTVTLGSDDRQ